MDNMISYQRFTNMPVNISEFGSTAEEYALTKGKAETNIMIAPMATNAADGLLAPKTSSDSLRVEAPATPQVNEFEGPKLHHITVRGALTKGTAKIGRFIADAVKNDPMSGISADRRGQILASLSKESAMCDLLGRFQRLQEGVYSRVLGQAKG